MARQQLKWVFYSAALALTIGTVGWVIGLMNGVVGFARLPSLVLGIVLVLGIAVAVLRYRLYDIDLVIEQTLIYGLVSAILAGVFAVLSFGSQRLLEALTGQHSDLASGGEPRWSSRRPSTRCVGGSRLR